MIRAEIECYLIRRNGEDDLMKSYRVGLGDSKKIEFLGNDAKVFVYCRKDGAVVSIINRKRRVSVVKYVSETEEKGRRVKSNGLLKIAKGEEISILARREPGKEVVVFLSHDSGNRDVSPQEPFDGLMLPSWQKEADLLKI